MVGQAVLGHDEGRRGAGDVLRGHVDGHTAGVRHDDSGLISRDARIDLLSFESIVNSWTVPWGTPGFTANSGAGV